MQKATFSALVELEILENSAAYLTLLQKKYHPNNTGIIPMIVE